MRLLILLLLAASALGCGRPPARPSTAAAAPTSVGTLAAGSSPTPAVPSPTPATPIPVEPRSAFAAWPWPGARRTTLEFGAVRYMARDPRDGTVLMLLEYEAPAAHGVHFELYDADEDDATPNDGALPDPQLTAPHVFTHLQNRGTMLAVVDGPFYAITDAYRHTAPVVRRGRVLYNDGPNPRWTFGVKDTPQGPRFSLVHRAIRRQLETFDWASGNVQALIVDGAPTRLQAAPTVAPQNVSPPSTPEDCGPYPWIDYLKTARSSLGWQDGRFALLLVFQAPADDESKALQLRKDGQAQRSGWDIADLQKFWIAWGARGACNFDGGLSTQVAWRDASGRMRCRVHNGVADLDTDDNLPQTAPVLLYPYVVHRR